MHTEFAVNMAIMTSSTVVNAFFICNNPPMIVMPVYSLFTTNPGSFDGLMTNTAWIC